MSATVDTAATGSTCWVTAFSPAAMTVDGYRSSFSGRLVFAG